MYRQVENYMKYVFALSSISLAVPFFFHMQMHNDINGEAGGWLIRSTRARSPGFRV